MLALLGVLVAGGVRPAYGGNTGVTFVITKTADTNDGSCDADCSLREAVVAANAASGDDEITLPSGTYALTITGSAEDRAATGDLDIRDSLTVRGAGARATIIDGGGIDRVFHTPTQPGSTPYTVNIFSLTITGGSVFDGQGGGIAHLARGANLNLTESTVRGNSAFQGGGIDNSSPSGSTMTITRSTVSGNKASGQGGGIQNTGGLTLTNTTVSGNKSRFGGGIVSNTPLRITDSTIAFNTAQKSGGGIYVTSGITTRIKNTIVSNNKLGVTKDSKNCSDPVTSEGNNLENGTSCGLNEPTDVDARKPKLGKKLKDNGGRTDTHALKKGSPAIDAGGTPFPPIDQRGIARPQGSANDIGAFERNR